MGYGFNSFRVDFVSAQAPRVARSSQPWAERCNPFGIEKPAIRPAWVWPEGNPNYRKALRLTGVFHKPGAA